MFVMCRASVRCTLMAQIALLKELDVRRVCCFGRIRCLCEICHLHEWTSVQLLVLHKADLERLISTGIKPGVRSVLEKVAEKRRLRTRGEAERF